MPNVRTMPVTAYNRTVCTIRDYPRMQYESYQLSMDVECLKSASYDGMPKGSSGGSGLEDKVIRLADLDAEIKQIREAIETIPADMRDGIMNNILYNISFPRNGYAQMVPSYRTWQREKNKFIAQVAHKLKIYCRK